MSHGNASIDAARARIPAGHFLGRIPHVAATVGGVFLVASVALALLGGDEARRQFFFSYLVAYLFFLSIALGALIFVLIQFAARAGWSVLVRRIAENLMGVLPLMALLFVPIFIGRHDLFHWMHEHEVEHDPILQAKQPFLNAGFFVVRAVLYFAIWSGLAVYFRRQSVLQDTTGDHAITRRLQAASGPGIVAFAFTATFAAFDWIMSLEPHWYSTIFGGYFFAGSFVAVLAVMILVCQNLRAAGFLGQQINAEHYHDLGKLLFAFVVFWAYIAFSQFMLIWYANIPEETIWYHERLTGSWRTLSVTLLVGHFVVPFLYLMPRTVKRSRPAIYAGAVYMLLLHYADLHWLVMPVLHPAGVDISLLDVTCFLAVAGFFQAAFALLMTRVALVPLKDPRLPESLAFENY